MKRRKFVENTMSFAALILLHNQAQRVGQLVTTQKSSNNRKCRFPEITLHTSRLEDQFKFYSETLNFTIIEKTESYFTLSIGESILRFKKGEVGSDPFYHYAINIPSNKYKQASKWLSEKTPLLGGDIFYFDFWDAHAMYFKDPAGNIGELIARHTLDNDSLGEFGTSDLLYVSEIGTPAEDPNDLANILKNNYGIGPLGESMFIGDEYGLFVTVPTDRPWFPEFTDNAEIYPLEIYISDEGPDNFNYKNYPYSIKRKH